MFFIAEDVLALFLQFLHILLQVIFLLIVVELDHFKVWESVQPIGMDGIFGDASELISILNYKRVSILPFIHHICNWNGNIILDKVILCYNLCSMPYSVCPPLYSDTLILWMIE